MAGRLTNNLPGWLQAFAAVLRSPTARLAEATDGRVGGAAVPE